ncbi:MAG: dihydrofolate reductase family protein [Chloroflexi bacterium]|nr:dihydrofolate reductase family protein [Chloroflexota bacterium]
MAIVEADISVSVDGFITGPNLEQEPGLGEGGAVLHAWIDEPAGKRLLDEAFASAGAVITSRKVYELTAGWGDDGFYKMPVFVVTHRAHDQVVKGDTTFTFVADGIRDAVARAVAAAGARKVHIMGGASIIQQALKAGVVDQVFLHVAPVVLGSGTPLFAQLGERIGLERIETIETPSATHQRYRVVK